MERKSTNNTNADSDKVAVLLMQLIQLLQENNEKKWAAFLEDLLNDYLYLTVSQDEKQAARRILNSMRGGMGSFLDLVLQRKNQMLVEENNLLQSLQEQVHAACKMLILPQLSPRIAANFMDGKYRAYEVDLLDYVVYHHSIEEEPMGQFFVEDKPANTENVYMVKVLRGAVIYVGDVISQGQCKGGVQIYVGKSSALFEIEPVK